MKIVNLYEEFSKRYESQPLASGGFRFIIGDSFIDFTEEELDLYIPRSIIDMIDNLYDRILESYE